MENTKQFIPLMEENKKALQKSNSRESSHGYRRRGKIRRCCQQNLLLVLTICGVVSGLVLGFALMDLNMSTDTIMLLSFPGEILMRMLKMLIAPLIISSLISGMASLDPKCSGKLGIRAICYYIGTTLIAIIIGISVVISIHPGDPSTKEKTDKYKSIKDEPGTNSMDSLLDVIRNIFPDNIIQAGFQQTKTQYVLKEMTSQTSSDNQLSSNTSLNSSANTTGLVDLIQNKSRPSVDSKWVRTLVTYDGFNALGVMTFSIAFGIFLSTLGHRGKPLVNFFTILNDVIFKMVYLVMWYSPIGIMSLIIGNILRVGDPLRLGTQLGLFIVTVLSGLAIHSFIALPAIYFIVVRKNPFRVISALPQAFATVIGTSSSSATLPVTFRCLEGTLGVDPRVTRFVLPVGATINMDGTALYEAVSAIFIAQFNGIPLDFSQIIIISVTSTLASIGAATIPSAGLVTMIIVLTAVGLPLEDISLIFTIDWFLDRIRTLTNVLGDAIGACVVEHLSREDLQDECFLSEPTAQRDDSPPRPHPNGQNIPDYQFNSDLDNGATTFERSPV